MYVKSYKFHNKYNHRGHENVDHCRAPFSLAFVEQEFQTKYACTREEFQERILQELILASKSYKRKTLKESQDTFLFGKYKGKKCSDVRDTPYAAWLYFECRSDPDIVKLIVENYDLNSLVNTLFRRNYG